MSITRAQAKQLRRLLLKQTETLPDEEVVNVPIFVEKWKADIYYEAGKRLNYKDIVYKVISSHTSQEDWTPDQATSLYAKILIPDSTIIPDWEQPESTNPYMIGDKVRHKDQTWVSDIDNNVWEPGVSGWHIEE